MKISIKTNFKLTSVIFGLVVLCSLTTLSNYSFAVTDPTPTNVEPASGSGSVESAVKQQNNTSRQTFTLSNPLRKDINSVGSLVKNFVNIISILAVILGVLALIWVGLQFILARGDATRLKELKEWLLWIVVGIAVVIGARLIVDIVINTLSATGTVDANSLNSIKNAIGK